MRILLLAYFYQRILSRQWLVFTDKGLVIYWGLRHYHFKPDVGSTNNVHSEVFSASPQVVELWLEVELLMRNQAGFYHSLVASHLLEIRYCKYSSKEWLLFFWIWLIDDSEMIHWYVTFTLQEFSRSAHCCPGISSECHSGGAMVQSSGSKLQRFEWPFCCKKLRKSIILV